jgi:hypothetical protein
MKTEKWGSEFGEKLKGRILFCACRLDVVRVDIKPRSVKGARAKDIAAGPTKAVPVAHRNPQVILHAFAGNNAVRVIHPVMKPV